MLIISGTMAGCSVSHRVSSRVKFIEEFIRFIEFIKSEIRYSSSALKDIISKYDSDSCISEYIKQCMCLLYNQYSFESAWSLSIDNIHANAGLEKRDIELIKSFGCGLGKSDTYGQISHCELNIELMKSVLDAARDSQEKKCKLYVMLGTFSGAAISVMFI